MPFSSQYPKSQKLLDNPQALCNILRRITLGAGDILLEYFDDPSFDSFEKKEDGTPVSEADYKAEEYIQKQLAEITPDIPFVGEESFEAGAVSSIEGETCFWMVDALDGTRAFLKGEEDFTVNIALIVEGIPRFGVVYAPVYGELYAACGEGTALRWMADTNKEKPIRVRDLPRAGLTVFAGKAYGSKPAFQTFIEKFKVAKVLHRSSSIKMCVIAAGKADMYARFGPTCEWDTAASDAILRAAGGMITDMGGQPLSYGKQKDAFLNPEFIASSFQWFDGEGEAG